jgi:hypothetical protein
MVGDSERSSFLGSFAHLIYPLSTPNLGERLLTGLFEAMPKRHSSPGSLIVFLVRLFKKCTNY